MEKQATSKRGITPPKGRPTRARNDVYGDKRVFGATAQWIAVTLLIILVFVVLFILTDGGSYFGNNGGHTGSLLPLLSFGSAVT
jgi:hypothetical protein